MGFTKERKLPALAQQTFNSWYQQHYPKLLQKLIYEPGGKYIFQRQNLPIIMM